MFEFDNEEEEPRLFTICCSSVNHLQYKPTVNEWFPTVPLSLPVFSFAQKDSDALTVTENVFLLYADLYQSIS